MKIAYFKKFYRKRKSGPKYLLKIDFGKQKFIFLIFFSLTYNKFLTYKHTTTTYIHIIFTQRNKHLFKN